MATIPEALDAALTLHGSGRLDEAAELYGRILAADPDHGRTLYFAGTLLCQQGRFAEAQALLTRAVTRIPDLAAAHLNLAKIHAGGGDWTAAIAASLRVLVLDPADAAAWELLGTTARQSAAGQDGAGQTETAGAAIPALGRALRLTPDAGLGNKLGLLLFERGRHHLDERRSAAALADLTAAAALLPFDPDLGFARATALVELGRNADAAALYTVLAAWSPADPRILHNLGIALTRIGRTGDLVRALHRAALLDPANPDPCEALAAAFDGRDSEVALSWSTRALTIKLERAANAMPVPPPAAPSAGGGFDVVSFSLWGALEVYCGGAVDNARQVPDLLPGWRCRFYHDDSVPAHILAELTALGAELVAMPRETAARQGMFWRFLAADDPAVRRFLCRDCDSRLTRREIAAIRAWVGSGRPFHVMRDHVMHMEPVMGGMWGGTAGALPPIRTEIDHFTASRSGRWNDQHFLAEWLWPRIAGRALVHDGVHDGLGDPFPEPVAADERHVGAKLFHLSRLPAMREPDGTEALAEVDGRHGRLAFPPSDPQVGLSLDRLGEWLEIETALCTRFLTAGDVALDADAGIGAHALAFARAVGPQGRVLAVEPSPGLFAALTRSLALNGSAHDAAAITPRRSVAAAAADMPAAVPIRLIRKALGDVTVEDGPVDDRTGGTALFDIVARHRPVLYLRIDRDGPQTATFARLMALDYRLWWHIAPVFNPANRHRCTGNPWPGLVTVNALALPPGPDRAPPWLVPIDSPDAAWQEASWRLTCDGR